MSDQEDNSQRESSAGDADLAGRLRSSTGLDSDSDTTSDSSEAVDRLSERLRSDSEEPSRLGGNPSPTLSEGNDDADEEGGGDSPEAFEDVLLEALDAEEDDEEASATPSTSTSDELADSRDSTSKAEESQPYDTDQQVVQQSDTSPAPGGEARTLECPSCEASNPVDTRFCVQCGERLDSEPSSERSRSSSEIRIPSPDRDSGRADDVSVPRGLQLVSIRDDGSDGKTIPIKSKTTIVGRDGDERFPTDEFLNPKHARLLVEDGSLYVEDLHSLNGTFIKIRGEVELQPGDTFLMGRQVLRFEKIEEDFETEETSPDGTRYMGSPPPGGDYKILQLGASDRIQDVYCLPESGVVLGREKGDIIFPRDKFMSGRHARIVTDEVCHLVDLNSSNGTWIKLWDKTKLEDEDYLFMGQQLFRMERNQSRSSA